MILVISLRLTKKLNKTVDMKKNLTNVNSMNSQIITFISFYQHNAVY